MYPATIVNRKYYPAHLGLAFIQGYAADYEKRLRLKPLAKDSAKIKGLVASLKLELNSVFGKLGSIESWLYDKKTLYSVTLTGQYSLLMLIEELELNNFRVIMANTDGIETIVPVSREDEYYRICREWEKLTNYELEFDNYESMFIRDVNNYLAVTKKGDVKKKGVFLTELELWKNKSMLVRAKALEAYFVNGISPEESIREHSNIYDFCIRGKANGGDKIILHFKNEIEEIGNLARYYLSTNESSPIIYKQYAKDDSIQNLQAANDLGTKRVAIFNNFEEKEDYQIDYNQYIYETYRIIAAIEGNSKEKNFLQSAISTNQLKLL